MKKLLSRQAKQVPDRKENGENSEFQPFGNLTPESGQKEVKVKPWACFSGLFGGTKVNGEGNERKGSVVRKKKGCNNVIFNMLAGKVLNIMFFSLL